MTRIHLLLLSILLSFSALAKQAEISGECQNCKGMAIKLMAYDDLISMREVILEQNTVEQNGLFSFNFDIQEVKYAWVQVEEFRYDFYLSPGLDLKIAFDKTLLEKELTLPFRGTINLIPEFKESSGAVLNKEIIEFNERLDKFMEAQYELLMVRKAAPVLGKKVERFKHDIDSIYSDVKGFFADYIEYSIANVELVNSRKPEYLFKDYLDGRKMLYGNLEFMRFFEQFYSKSLSKVATGDRKNEFRKAFKLPEPDGAFQALLSDEPYMENEVHKQAIYIKGLGDLCGTGIYNQMKLVDMLKRFSIHSSNGKLARIAKNLAWKHGRFMDGQPAPEFYARTVNGDLISLKAFEGKHLLIEFSMVGNGLCERETIILPALMKEYPQYQMVTFMVNEVRSIVWDFAQKEGLDWPVVRLDQNSQILEDYDVRSVPRYILLDSKGSFLQYQMTEPSRGLDKVLFEQKEKGKKGFSVGKKKSGFHDSNY